MKNLNKFRLAVLITTYNRRETVLKCLEHIYNQENYYSVLTDIYLLIDGSNDGTTEAVSELFPSVNLLFGDGNLYWCGGMRRVFAKAMEEGYDFYLWLNEDTFLDSNAFNILFSTYENVANNSHQESIIVGSTLDSNRKSITYGGRLRSSWWHPLRFEKFVIPDGTPQECDTINGNCVLIPYTTAKKVGNIDELFVHKRGDYDYGLRAKRLGCSLWVAFDYIAICDRDKRNINLEMEKSIKHNLNKFIHPKSMPFKEQACFTKRHGGPLWFLFFYGPYVKFIIKVFFSYMSNYKKY